ncbi:uncharacterized protein PGTG_20463, partial [Puccinia graminis f. sp. tritici CRL 75-36-700-3]
MDMLKAKPVHSCLTAPVPPLGNRLAEVGLFPTPLFYAGGGTLRGELMIMYIAFGRARTAGRHPHF